MFNKMKKCMASSVGFYADGDGDFRPKFKIDAKFDQTEGYWRKDYGDRIQDLEVIYDAE